MTPIKLNNGEGMMLVEVPEDAIIQSLVTQEMFINDTVFTTVEYVRKNIISMPRSVHVSDKKGLKILGTYHKGEIDFEANPAWVENNFVWYKDYETKNMYTKDTAKGSFISLLKSIVSQNYLQHITTEETSNIRTVNLAKHEEYLNKKYVVLIEIKK